MKTNYFTKVEDKYVFRVSTVFWHLLIGILTLVAIVGMCVLGWSLMPPGKGKVTVATYPVKQSYPPVERVFLSDLHLNDASVQPIPGTTSTDAYKPIKKGKLENDPDKPAYDLSLAELRSIIPTDQWSPGRYIVTNELAWEMYHSEQYRIWESSGSSVDENLENSYNKIWPSSNGRGAIKYGVKKVALDSYIKIVREMPNTMKGKAIELINNSVNENFSDLKLLDSVCTFIGSLKSIRTEKANEILISFSFNNPYDCFLFIPFALETCNRFSDSLQVAVLSALISSYYNYFYRNTVMQREATEQFLQFVPQISSSDKIKALYKFYYIFNQKNENRNKEIARLENEFNIKMEAIRLDSADQAMKTETKFILDKELKSFLRGKSLYAIAGVFIAIALLGTILTLLSIQRILKRMAWQIEKTNDIDLQETL